MTKKSPRHTLPSGPPSTVTDDVLFEIKNKLHSSKALNGGFDALVRKIDKIEQSQDHLVAKVDKIHESIYDPNEGIFSKMNDMKINHVEQLASIENKLVEVSEWKKTKEKIDDKQDTEVDKFSKKLTTIESTVESLHKSKIATWNVLKWILVAIGGGLITLVFKYFEKKLTVG